MTPEQLKTRTKAFAVAIVHFARHLPTDQVAIIMTRQLVRSGTGVGSNYRSSCRAKSRADFISKMTTAGEEADEAQVDQNHQTQQRLNLQSDIINP
jgi:four helix bundle protein